MTAATSQTDVCYKQLVMSLIVLRSRRLIRYGNVYSRTCLVRRQHERKRTSGRDYEVRSLQSELDCAESDSDSNRLEEAAF
ncbi:uncharacterized [Tachysurus ichikawai]